MLSRPFLAIFFAAVAAAACSSGSKPGAPRLEPASPPGDGGAGGTAPTSRDASTIAAAVKKDVCTTLDYGHDRSNADFYMQFADDAAAVNYSKDFLPANDMPPDSNVSNDARLARILGHVFDGFRIAFPAETAGMASPPRLLIVPADGLNAFVGYDERDDVKKAPWIIWVHSAVPGSSNDDAAIEGLLGHELAHLILRNFLPQTRDKIRTHYRLPNGLEQGVIGAVTPDEPAVHARAEELITLGALVGRESVFKSLPVTAYEDNRYYKLLLSLAKLRQPTLDQQQPCAQGDDGLGKVKDFYENVVSVHDLTLHLTPAQSTQLATLRDGAIDAMKKCYATTKMSLLELKVRDLATQLPAAQQKPFIDKTLDPTTDENKVARRVLLANQVEQDVEKETDLTTIERLFEVVETNHRRVATLEADPSLPIDQLRVFELEEDADDAAVRILKANREDPLSGARLFASQIPNADDCFSSVESGVIPEYGRFIDPHNATCWRWFHSREMARALDKCPAQPAPVAAVSNGAAAATQVEFSLVRRLDTKRAFDLKRTNVRGPRCVVMRTK